jgi:hypothetical protein
MFIRRGHSTPHLYSSTCTSPCTNGSCTRRTEWLRSAGSLAFHTLGISIFFAWPMPCLGTSPAPRTLGRPPGDDCRMPVEPVTCEPGDEVAPTVTPLPEAAAAPPVPTPATPAPAATVADDTTPGACALPTEPCPGEEPDSVLPLSSGRRRAPTELSATTALGRAPAGGDGHVVNGSIAPWASCGGEDAECRAAVEAADGNTATWRASPASDSSV